MRPLSDEMTLIGPPTHSRRKKKKKKKTPLRRLSGWGCWPVRPGGNGLAPYRAPGPGSLQDRQADEDLVVHGTPGHPDGPGNHTIAGIAIRDAHTGTGIIITQDGSVRWVIYIVHRARQSGA